jgi:hypothetical protein
MNIQRSFCLSLVVACGMLGAVQDANISEITIYRQKPGSSQQETIKVDYAAIKKNKTPDVFLKPYDVIDVSESGFFGRDVWLKNVISALTGGIRNSLSQPIYWP